jgi:hypothetical protein
MMIDNPTNLRVQATFLRFHVKLMAKGMSHSKLTRTRALELASQITGKAYKRGQHAIAAADLDAWLAANPR